MQTEAINMQQMYFIFSAVAVQINCLALYKQVELDPEKQLNIKGGFFSTKLTFQPTR